MINEFYLGQINLWAADKVPSGWASCGCLVPEWPKEPVLPGGSATIKAKYDTQRVGPFMKQITLTSNDGTNPTLVLTVKGEVKDTPKQESVPASNGGLKQ